MNYRKRTTSVACAIALAATAASVELSADASDQQSAQPSAQTKPPPLPLHQIEGNGGVFSTLSAYLVNPPRNGEPVGRPSVGFCYVNIGHGRDLVALTLTETPWARLELGFGYNLLNLGDLPTAIAASGGPSIDDNLAMYHANARLQLLREGEFGIKWLPAITAGVHYKYNDQVSRINNQLGGALDSIGLTDDAGVDFTLYASKMLTLLPRPVLVNLGVRATESAQLGLLGFTDDYSFVFEGNVVVLATDRFMVAAEFKQQPAEFTPVPLIGKPDHWWTIAAGYVVNPHMTVAIGYGHFGRVANHRANGVWGITTKWEF